MATQSPAPFLWGQGGVAKTPEQVKRDREMAALLMRQGADYSPVGHWLQGAARASQGLLGGLESRWADEAETAGRDAYKAEFDSVFGGGSQVAAALAGGEPATALGATNAMASIPTGDMASTVRNGLISRGLPEHVADAFILNMQDESGLNPGINEAAPIVPGSRGGYGLYQLTGPRRTAYEAFAGERGVDPSDVDAQLDFLMSELQGPEARAAEAIFAAQDTPTAAAAIVNQFLRPSEEHRARREAAYLGGSPRTQVAQAGGQPSIAQLIGLAGNEWASPGQNSVVQALLGQQMQQQDPRYQQDLAMGDLQLRQLQQQLNAQPYQPRVLTPGEMEQWGLPSNSGSWVLPENGIPQNLYSAPAPNTDFETITIDVPGVGPQTFNTADPQQYQIANDLLAQGATEIKTPAAQVNIGAETGYDSTVGKGMGERYLSLQDEASTARSALNSLDIMEQAMSQPGFYSGFGADQLAQVKKLGQSLGLNVDGIDSMEAFNAQAKSAALDTMGGSLGTGFSNADRDFVLDQVPTLSNTPQGNAALIKVQRAINQRKIDVARLSREYAASNNGRLDAGFDDYLADWAEQNPLFPDGGVFGTPTAPSPNTTSSGVTWSFVD